MILYFLGTALIPHSISILVLYQIAVAIPMGEGSLIFTCDFIQIDLYFSVRTKYVDTMFSYLSQMHIKVLFSESQGNSMFNAIVNSHLYVFVVS